jgi:hypothetical protein
MLEQFRESYEADEAERREALNDIEFASGKGQWAPEVEAWRTTNSRPMLTINQMPTFIDQITGEMRQNKTGIIVHPVDELATPENAATLEGLIREIEDYSHAGIAYITAEESAATCGRGFYRILTERENELSFNQRLKIVRIPNAFSVWWDHSAMGFFLEDSNYWFITNMIRKTVFQKKYPDADPAGFDNSSGDTLSGLELFWNNNDMIRIAEWFRVVEEPFTLYQAKIIVDGQTIFTTTDKDKDLPEGMELVLNDDGKPISRPSSHRKILWSKVTSNEEIEGPITLDGKYVPVVPIWGKEMNLGEHITKRGVVRFAKDSQRAYNYAVTAHIEAMAMSPKAPYVAGKSQIEGYEDMWMNASQELNTLIWNDANPNSNPPRREPPVQAQPGLSQEILLRAQELKATTGLYNENIGQQGNATSGIAIQERAQKGQTGNIAYSDNAQMAIAWGGQIIIDLIPKVYDTERVVNIINREGKRERIRINSTVKSESIINTEKEIKTIQDLGKGSYRVTTAAGPSYLTARVAAVNAMIEMLRVSPQIAPYIMDIVAKNMDWQGAEELAERLQLLVPPEARPKKEPDEQQVAQMQVQQVMVELQKKKAELEIELEGRNIDKVKSEILLNNSKTRQIEWEIVNGKIKP